MVTMKIYNEVVYQIVDNQLVKVSEDSFDYEGEVSKCKGGGGTLGQITKTVTGGINKGLDNTFEAVDSTVKTLTEGPGGTLKKATDTIRDWSDKGSHHLFGTDYNGDDSDDNLVDPTVTQYEGGEDDASAELTAKRRQQNNMRGRGAANQTSGQSASLLTK